MNTLDRLDYRGQRNNETRSATSCNTTMIIMCFYQAGWKKEVQTALKAWNIIAKEKRTQPEDALSDFLLQEHYRESAAEKLGNLYYDRPAEVWQVLCQAANDFIGRPIVKISWTATIDRLRSYIAMHCGVGVSGDFPGTDGHFVNVGDISEKYAFINDPYGDHTRGYKLGLSGYNVKMDIEEFERIIKGSSKYPGTFFGMIVSPKG